VFGLLAQRLLDWVAFRGIGRDAAQAADAEGNLYLGPNTEDTPAIVEATAFSGGLVIAHSLISTSG
jgi:hypothetical protein